MSDVLLLEKDELASGSTCKAAGGVRASFSNAANIAIGLRGLEVYSRFAQDHDQEIDFSRDGYLYTLSDQTNVESSPNPLPCRTATACRAGWSPRRKRRRSPR